MFGPTVSLSCPGDALSFEQGDSVANPPTDHSADIYTLNLSGSHGDCENGLRPEEVKVSSSGKSQYIILTFTATEFPFAVFSADTCTENEEYKV